MSLPRSALRVLVEMNPQDLTDHGRFESGYVG